MKTNIKLLLATILLLTVAITACNKPPIDFNDEFTIDVPTAEFRGDSLIFPRGFRQTITIDVATEAAGGQWNAISPSDDVWVSFSQKGSQLVVTVDHNHTDMPRTSWIEFSLGENKRRIVVYQEHIRVLTFAAGTATNVGAAARINVSLALSTNIAQEKLSVSIKQPVDWLTNLTLGDNRVTFDLARNSDTENTRQAILVIAGDNVTAEIVVTQNALTGFPYVINLSDMDFSRSYIYEIWDEVNNIKIGELCLEYLHKLRDGDIEPIIEKQMTVAYPMEGGRVDLSNGLVIENGFSVSWNPNITHETFPGDMLASYEPDETVVGAASIIYLDEGASRFSTYEFEAAEEDRINAVLRPLLLVDYREGSVNNVGQTTETETYKMVKIGTQYWIAENLRTRRFADGEPILTDIANDDWSVRVGPTLIAPTNVAWHPGVLVSAFTTSTSNTTITYNNANATSGTEVANRNRFGCLYNVFALINFRPPGHPLAHETPVPADKFVDKISPKGWNVPTLWQYQLLFRYVFQTTSTVAQPSHVLSAYHGNETGFGAIGGRERGGSGSWNSRTQYLTIDSYRHVPNASTFDLWHMMSVFQVSDGAPPGTVYLASFASRTAAAGQYVRLIRD